LPWVNLRKPLTEFLRRGKNQSCDGKVKLADGRSEKKVMGDEEGSFSQLQEKGRKVPVLRGGRPTKKNEGRGGMPAVGRKSEVWRRSRGKERVRCEKRGRVIALGEMTHLERNGTGRTKGKTPIFSKKEKAGG